MALAYRRCSLRLLLWECTGIPQEHVGLVCRMYNARLLPWEYKAPTEGCRVGTLLVQCAAASLRAQGSHKSM